MSEWKPIETAPRDGTPILAYGPGTNQAAWKVGVDMPALTAVVEWSAPEYEDYEDLGDGLARRVTKRMRGHWRPYHVSFFLPTHWMPLPAAPEGPLATTSEAMMRAHNARTDANG